MPDIYKVIHTINTPDLSANQAKILLCIIDMLNVNRWKAVPITAAIAGVGMSKNTFLKERRALVDDGWIVIRQGEWKTTAPVYDLGPRFNNTKLKKGKEMRSPEEIKKLVIEIDQQYPHFSELCARHKWDKAIEVLKAGHPELQLSHWAVDSIGDPENRKQAHEMFVKLHSRKGGQAVVTPKLARPDSSWTPFHLFVDMWLLSYPKKASKASVRTAVKEFIADKEQWTPGQVKDLQDKIEAHSRDYVATFGDDIKYMVSPANYFASEKWTEKVSVKYDKTDINYKTAGAPARPNMPAVTTIKAN
jgi:hypothetical protein